MSRTIKELSEVCKVSEQALRAWCRKNNVPKDAKGKGFAINETTEMAILQHYGAVDTKDTKAKERKHESNSETLIMLEILQKELDFCKEQLEVKDNQIATLQKALEGTTEALSSAQESLKASQFLQANAEQKLLQIDQKNDEEAVTEEPKKKHWWQFSKRE
jgi:DNA-binding transcriptional MerR regulator